MRRDYFELTVEGVDDDTHRPVTPLVRIDFHGPDGLLRDRLSGTDGTLLAADDVDVAFRLREPLSTADDSEGVVGVTNRYTGDFILELNETATDVLSLHPRARAIRRATRTPATGSSDRRRRRAARHLRQTHLPRVRPRGTSCAAQREPDPVRRRALTGRRASSADDPSEIGTENKATYPLCSTGQQSNYEIS